MAVNMGTDIQGRMILKCAFCGGVGTDPFELLSSESRCQVCGGKGRVSIREPARVCAYCKGTGIHPHRRLTCTVCNGKGMITVKELVDTCPDCMGQGWVSGQYLPCLTCGGKGVVKKE